MTDRKEKILTKLYSLLRGSINPGLERTRQMLSETGNPERNFKSIHIAGTNGKGSVSSIIASAIMESGAKTALYTSPHIINFNERIRIGGVMISDDDLVRLAELYMPYSDTISATFFEITTAMAFKYFSENSVDFAVIETGMGGRFDSTNVLEPIASVITSISLDHCEFLGNTIQEIATEKAGIIKPQTPVFVARNPDNVMNIVRKIADEQSAELIYTPDLIETTINKFNPDFTMDVSIVKSGGKRRDVKCTLSGRHQTDNLSTACAVCDRLASDNILPKTNSSAVFDLEATLRNLKRNTGLFGRIECLNPELPTVLDVSHNSDGLRALVCTLRDHGYGLADWHVVFGGMADKDIREMLSALLPITKALYLPKLHIERAMNPDRIKELAMEIGFVDVQVFSSMADAYAEASGNNSPVLCAGSFHVAEEVLPIAGVI
jgi:dihydrofolate synthase/folylpolyglutamate synthase